MNNYGSLLTISIPILILLIQSTTQFCSETLYKTKKNSTCKTFEPYSRSCREYHQENFYELRCVETTTTIESDHPEEVHFIVIHFSDIDAETKILANFSNVESLRLSWSSLNVLYKENFNTKGKLESLFLSSNAISVVEDGFLTGFVHLKTLQLDNNIIVDASPLLSNCGNISSLILSHNRIKRVEFTRNCLKLKMLALDGNNIYEFKVNIETASELEHLNVSTNNINHIEGESLRHFPALKILDLSNNPLFKLNDLQANLFVNKPKLEYLNVSATEIWNIAAGTFAQLPALQTLDLSHNNLRYIQRDMFRNLTKIRSIYLNNNYLTEFEYEASAYESTIIIDLNDNLLDCDLLEDISQTLQKRSVFLRRGLSGNVNSILGVSCVVVERRTSSQANLIEKSDASDLNEIQRDMRQIVVEQKNLYNLSNFLYESVKRDMKKVENLPGSYRSMVVGIYFVLFILIAGLGVVSLLLFKKYKIVRKSEAELRNLNSFDT